MRKTVIICAILLTLAGCKEPGSRVVHIGGANVDAVFGIAGTDDGRSCITGTFIAEVDFGSPAKSLMLNSGGYSDIFVACYLPDGTPAFATRFGVTQKNDQPRAIAALPGGDVLVAGFFSKTFGIAPGPVLEAPGAVNADAFVARVDAQGKTVWANGYGGPKADSARSVAHDGNGNILLAGTFQGVMPVLEDGAGRKLVSAGSGDAFVLKLSGDGTMLWGRRFGGAGNDEAFAVAATRDGTIVVAGTYSGEASTDVGPVVEATGYNDVFLQAYSPSGEALWTRSFGGEGQEYVGGVAATDNGRLWLAGSFQREIDFDDRQTLVSAGSTDGMLVRVDADGNFERMLSFGGAQVELLYGIATAPDGTLLVTGYYQGDADLAPGPETRMFAATTPSDNEGFVLRLDRDGGLLRALPLSGRDAAVGSGVAAFTGGDMAVTGIFSTELRLPGADETVLNSRGKTDILLLRTDL